ncbi:MAG: helix-turn-helix domain-containing protein [Enterococcus sp.]
MDISGNIKRLRKEKNMTQVQLAELLDVVPTTISAWESGRNKPLMDKVTIMADIFGVSTSEIVGDTFTEDNINVVFQQLDETRKNKVVNYAKKQLKEQKALIPFRPKDEIDTLAAHSKDPKKVYTPEEIDDIKAYLDKLSEEYDKKHK